MDPRHILRQIEILPPRCLSVPINIIGAGAIGSFTALALAKMGFDNFTVFDFDKVDPENMSCQFYRHKDIGLSKVTALNMLIEDFTGGDVLALPVRYESQKLHGIVISAVDSMEVRTQIWENAKKDEDIHWVIDPRMGAESALLYVMNPHDPKDIASYEKTLYSDESAFQEACTRKSTTYCALMLSGLVAKSVKDLVTDSTRYRITMWSIKDNQLNSWPAQVSFADVPEAIAPNR